MYFHGSVTREEAGEWAKSKGMLCMESSAKTKDGIAQVFSEVVQKVITRFKCNIVSILNEFNRKLPGYEIIRISDIRKSKFVDKYKTS